MTAGLEDITCIAAGESWLTVEHLAKEWSFFPPYICTGNVQPAH